MNVPNLLTSLRVVLAVALFAILPLQWYALGIVLFVAAALTDFGDGWWARRFGQITVFGRIMDPFADKLLICGTFIYMAAIPELGRPPADPPGVPAWLMFGPWMAVVILARELLITSLRGIIERRGGDFSAKWAGKWKMGLQCVAIPTAFLWLLFPYPFFFWAMIVTLWGTVGITIYSGVDYVIRAIGILRKTGGQDIE